MTERIRKGLIFLALPAAIIWAVMNGGDTPKKDVANNQAPAATIIQGGTAVTAISNAIDYDKYDQLDWGRDPFRTAIKSTPKAVNQPTWKLSGVVFNLTDPRAIINNRSLRKGDVVDGAKVVDIKKKEVILNYQGKNQTIKVTRG